MSRRLTVSLVYLLTASGWCWAQPAVVPSGPSDVTAGAGAPLSPDGATGDRSFAPLKSVQPIDPNMGDAAPTARPPYFAVPADPGPGAPDEAPRVFGDCPRGGRECAPRFWFTTEYLLWRVKDAPLPIPLVTSGCNCTEFSGAVGAFGTQILYGSGSGSGSADFGAQSGARFTGGWWFDPYDTVGVEAGGFFLAQQSSRASFNATGAPGDPILAVPFFNSETGTEDFADVAVPGELAGRVDVASSLRYWGVEGDFAFNFYRDRCACLDVLAGFRYQQLEESLQITGSSAPLCSCSTVSYRGAELPAPATTVFSDRYHTRNDFAGGQLGAKTEWRCGSAYVQLAGNVALGNTHQTVDASGYSALFAGPAGPLNTVPGGLFVQPSNGGRFRADAFTVVPEAKVTVGYQLTRRLRAFAGYQFTYWSSVVRPGDQINRNVNPTQVPTFSDVVLPSTQGPALPVFRTTDFWAHGLDLGLELRF